MQFRIDEQIFEKYPDLCLGLVSANGIDNSGEIKEIQNLIREREKEIKLDLCTETLSLHPRINSWRKAYSSFGAKPKKYKSSVESLLRMVLKGLDLRPINPIVDIYNYISLKHLVPVGGDDLTGVEGNIILRFARGDEPFIPLNSKDKETPKPGEVIYADEKEVLCRRWNWRECDKTKMTEKTRDIVLVAEGLPPVTKENMEEIGEDLCCLVEKHCGGKLKTVLLNRDLTEIEI